MEPMVDAHSYHQNNMDVSFPMTILNDTGTNRSHDLYNISLVPHVEYTKTVAVPAIMFCVGVVGNVAALLILTFKPSKDSRSTAFYNLVKALAIMDLFGIVASSPVTLIVYVKGGVLNTGGMPLCHYFSFILVMAGNATVFIVLVMGIERFLVTKYPFKYSKIVTPFTVNLSIGVVWAVSIITATLPIIGLGRNVERYPGTWCFFDDRSTDLGGKLLSYFYAITGITSIAVTIVFNLIVIQHLWRMRKSRLKSSVKSSHSSLETSRKCLLYNLDCETKMVIFLMAIIIVFTICYAPWMFRILVNQNINTDPTRMTHAEHMIDIWTLRLASLNQILDPWVYIISRVTCCGGRKYSDHSFTSESRKTNNDNLIKRLLIANSVGHHDATLDSPCPQRPMSSKVTPDLCELQQRV